MISNTSRPYTFEWTHSASNGTSANDTIVLSDISVTTFIRFNSPGIHDSHFNISNVRIGTFIDVQVKKMDNVEFAIENSTIGTFVQLSPGSGVSQFRNMSFGVRNSAIGTVLTANAQFFGSTLFIQNVSCKVQINIAGLLSQQSTLLLEEVTISTTNTNAVYMQSILEDSALIVDRCSISTTGFRAFTISQHTKGS